MIEQINDKSWMATMLTPHPHMPLLIQPPNEKEQYPVYNKCFLQTDRCSIAIAQQGVVAEQESISEDAVRLLYNSTRFRKKVK